MKNNSQPTHDMNTSTQTATHDNPQVKSTLKLGLDVDLQQITVTVQHDHQHPKPAQSFTTTRLGAWVREKVQAGHAVHTVYESCGFGYTLHDQRVAAGACSRVISPVRPSPERRRKNDRLDSRRLCLRLSRSLDGQRDELPGIGVPSPAEQPRRELGRQRTFWAKPVRQRENPGRALRLEPEFKTLPVGWAGPCKWKRLWPERSAFLRTPLEPLRAQMGSAKAHLERLGQQIEARVTEERLPKGLGRLTRSRLDGAVCAWHRFTHRKAPGSGYRRWSQRTQQRQQRAPGQH
jgi:hypothetical protein